jgi:Tfp pilus assembly protein PilZ
VDLSEFGGYVTTAKPYEPGTAVDVRFRHPESPQFIAGRAIVVRCDRTPGRRGIGLTFTKPVSEMLVRSAVRKSVRGEVTSRVVPTQPPEERRLRRREVRHPVSSTAVRYTSGVGGVVEPGHLEDVSRHGLAVRCSQTPEVGASLRVEITDEQPAGQPLRMSGRVAWALSPPGDLGCFGFEVLGFQGPQDEGHYTRFVERIKQTAPPPGGVSA